MTVHYRCDVIQTETYLGLKSINERQNKSLMRHLKVDPILKIDVALHIRLTLLVENLQKITTKI